MTKPNQEAMTDKSAPEQVELLRCPVPWCEGEARPFVASFQTDDGKHGDRGVMCANCCLLGPIKPNADEAAQAWNTRIQSQRPSPGVDVERQLVEAIVGAYHTTRIGTDFVPHILAKPKVRAAIASMPDERKLIVGWLRARSPHEYFHANSLADRIERGDHISATVEG